MQREGWARWTFVGVFVISTAINVLDRQALAAAAPAIKAELHLSNAGYGTVVSAFGVIYALAAPIQGWFIDLVDLTWAASFAMALWSTAGIATGFCRSPASLLACRSVLGAGESAGIPALAKVNVLVLRPSEFGLSLAGNNIAITLGSFSAPLLVGAVAPAFGWRSVFVLTGLIGFLWIPLWTACALRAPAGSKPEPRVDGVSLLRDRRLWGLTVSNALIMAVYTVWTNWTTLYFVQQLHLSATETNRHYAWIPPIFAAFGGFFGGWLSYHWIEAGKEPTVARLRGCWIAATLILVTAGIPWALSPGVAAALISTAMFWAMSLQMNVHILPVDLFGPERAGFSVSILAASYGLMQGFVSPIIGAVVDRFGFSGVCVTVSVLPLVGVWVLNASLPVRRPEDANQSRKQYA